MACNTRDPRTAQRRAARAATAAACNCDPDATRRSSTRSATSKKIRKSFTGTRAFSEAKGWRTDALKAGQGQAASRADLDHAPRGGGRPGSPVRATGRS